MVPTLDGGVEKLGVVKKNVRATQTLRGGVGGGGGGGLRPPV